ncbi:MAG: beta-ketoacyl-ACP synthase II [Deltaproteobacteria bacterium]|nr:beta-ketoacyl-ACP synthase II [Deltaproteobacteria bacterium]
MRRRVAVTGLGVVCPCGLDVPSTWAALLGGHSGVAPISSFDATGWPVRIAAEVKGFDPVARFGRLEARRMDRFSALARAAAEEAVADAGLDLPGPEPERVGVYLGTGIGGIGALVEGAQTFLQGGPRSLSPFFLPRVLANMAAAQVAIRHGARGPSLCVDTACAAGAHALGEAWRAIWNGDADVVLAGGSEAAVVPLAIAGFSAMKVLSRRNDDPARASRPFDAGRDGFVVGEGAAVLVLEGWDHAVRRDARILAELVGYALTCDAWHLTAPDPEGSGATRCMSLAIGSAHLEPEEIGYVNAHGTSTPANDVLETHAIRRVFGAHADRLAVSSTKSVTGHLLGAAGALEALATVLTLRDGMLPPTSTLELPDPECDLDYVPGHARRAEVRAALTNSFGFGGTNACLVLRRPEDRP